MSSGREHHNSGADAGSDGGATEPSQAQLESAAAILRDSLGEVVRRMRQTRPERTITWAEGSLLGRLAKGGPATSAELARAEGITPQSMGAILKSIEAAGFAQRSADPDDRRRVVFTVTPAGHDFYRSRIDARAAQFTESLAADFTPAEIEQLLAAAPLLERLADSIHRRFRSGG
jgi:DNA-binding MarR family transcriptional regulator